MKNNHSLYYILLPCFFILFSIPQIIHAQESVIKGIVLEETGQGKIVPVIGANVFWAGTTIGTTTDTNGIFRIPQEPRYYKLVVSFVGYISDTLTVMDTNEMKVVLRSGTTLKEVEITSDRNATYVDYLSPSATKTMTEKELFKAACCNLSESFETNPSVDVSFSDAITGTKQIQMLGLAGIYTQITTENLPGVRGLASNYGLSYIPGTWIESIQVTKGIGSVANGYESIAGQINVEMKKPMTAEKLYFNAYINAMGRMEGNLNLTQKIGKKWSTSLLTHSNYLGMENDVNHDQFTDIPTGRQFNVFNRWNYADQNWIIQLGIKALNDERKGGQMKDMNHHYYDSTANQHYYSPYRTVMNTERYEGFGKIGYIFPQKKYKSIGFMFSTTSHNYNSFFGSEIPQPNGEILGIKYDGKQRTFYSNLIYQSIIGNTNHKFRTGFSFLYDDYNEVFNTQKYGRTEIVPGAFVEYTYDYKEKLSIVAGFRADYHNIFGLFVTPRIHARYNLSDNTTLRASFGRGQRTANIFAENTSVFVSSRIVKIIGNLNEKVYGLNPEVVWNSGLNVTHEFDLGGKPATLSLDYYRTDFQNQVVVDLDKNPQEVNFYNLNGKSFSNSFQAELTYKPIRKLELRFAYRLYDVKTTFHGELLQRPLVAKNRAFVNVGYEWKKWKFDYTINWNGTKRIPNTSSNPEPYQKGSFSPGYFVMNTQVSKSFGKNFEAYAGIENLTNFRQNDLINSYDKPYGSYFDASLVWGPIIGRMPYGGVRYRIK